MASGDLSLTSTSSQEEESPEYVGYDRTLRPSLNSTGSPNATNLNNNNGLNSGNSSSGAGSGVVSGSSGSAGGGGGNGNNTNVSNGSQYDVIKSPYNPAFMELTQMRHQRADALCRCEELRGQVAYYQEQYVSAMTQLESTERNKFIDVIAENARLKQQNTKLERQLIRLENENGNKTSNAANAYYFSDVTSGGRGGSNSGGGGGGGNNNKCDGSCAESEKLLEELHLCKERNADLLKERSVIAAEREKYKKSFGSTIAELENVKKERNFYRESREHFNLQRDIMDKEIQKLKSLLSEESKKVLLITVERNRIDEELKQLLSEKDNVLHEHQKMFDDLSAAKKEIDNYKKNDLLYQSEINKLHQANAELQKRDLLKSNSWSKEFSDSKDDFKEVEKLRKSLEKANSEVERALQDAEQAKGVRDWAISQREKIVQERDSVKSLCDNLRKERDKAISDLLSAIRDSEKIKKQKDEAQKKIDVLKEQIENQNIDNASRRSFRMSTYEAEDLLDIELNYHSDSDIGIILDDSNNRQLVCGVTNSSPAFGKLKMNDVICKVNNLDCQTMTKRMVLDEIRSSAPRCKLLVSRTRHSKRHFYTVHLNMQNNMNHGLTLDTGVFISKIEPNSLAAYEPELDVGDRVLSVNNKSMECIHSVDDVMALLNDERNDAITIFALKNVQDISSSDGQRRMTTSSAQTDSIDSMHRMTSAKHPSKFSEMLSIFKKIHIPKPGSDVDHFTQEHDALAELDSVLSENSSEKPRRGKRSKKEKEAAAKSMGTWPRANILNATHENPTGTIVQQREKKRPPLALFTAGPINVDKDDERENSDDQPPPLPPQAKPQAHIRNAITGVGNAIKTNPHRNSNPIPASALFSPSPSGAGMSGVNGGVGNSIGNSNNVYANYMRHSVYVDPQIDNVTLMAESTKPLQRPAPIMGANMRVKMPPVPDKYGNQRMHNYQNRYSLNITPTEFYKTSGQQAQQQVIHTGNGVELLPRKPHIFDMLNSGNGNMGGMPSSVSSSKSQPHPGLFAPLNFHPQNFGRNTSTTQQNSLDMISIKSQNSIDSILSAKSPPISECAVMNHYTKRGIPMPQAATSMANKNVAKYPSDSESIASGIMSSSVGGVGTVGGGGGGIGVGVNNSLFHSNNMAVQSHNRHSQLFPTFTQNSSHPHSHAMRQIRHSSPLTLPSSPPLHAHPHSLNPHSSSVQQTQHGVDTAASSTIGIPTSSVDKFDMDFGAPGLPMHTQYVHDYPLSTHYHHSHTGGVPNSGGGGGAIIYEGGTFPRKKDHQRLRIPSNPSVASKSSAGVKNSSGSIDHHYGGGGMPIIPASMSGVPPTMLMHHSAIAAVAANGGGSGRGSPMPQVHVEVLSHGGSKRNSNTPSDFLCPGDLRRVTIEKSDKSLGITIQCNNNGGGIFVSTVADKSIATRAGLQVGDQLLEVCGLNMRSATNDIAANVLRQCGNSITMLVQYNPEKFHSGEYDGINNLETENQVNHSGSPTPRNSPRPPVRTMMSSLPPHPISAPTNSPLAQQSTQLMPQSSSLLSTQSLKDQSFADSLENQSDISSSQDLPSSAATTTTTASTSSTVYEEEARYVTLRMDKSKNLGIKLFGGNKVGIFVHDVHPGSPSDIAGIRKGDQILEYNGVDLRCVTAEQAANEISKLTDTVTLLVQNKMKKLKQIKDKSGDSFYIRVGFDRTGELNDGDLRFVKDEVLYVDNTVFNGTFGLWRAWKLDSKGHRKECGIIPSQMKVEEELRAGEVVDCEGGTARRGSTSARRSFFRRKKHQRSSSRDSTEIASFSNTQLSFFPDSGILNDDGGILSYQRVERLDSPVRRPVLIIGPLSERVMERLTIDFSNLFKMCEVTSMDCSQDAMEEGLQENIFVDYRRRGNKFECTTVENINNACKNDRRHCILDISISAAERLQRLHIYPIVLLLRFKSAKQIREIRDFGIDKISAKAAKEMYERALKLETDYKQYISAVIPGVSIKHMCTQIKDSVDKEQDKLLWVPVSG
ncbi:disks large homolog 5 [Eurosta solidaginis]|uniref:disks large homolog 5 n=1 Tax=Eurosta solidaginis TaxID=178769 RepID=UPI00353171CA